MTVYGIGGDYIPLLFFKFVLIFMKKLTHVGSEYSRNILELYSYFWITMYIIPNLLSFQMHHDVKLYTKLCYKLFFN